MLKLSVIILNYNTRYFLELCLYSVFKALKHIQSEVIVVDNASTDESLRMIHAQFPQVVSIANPINTGFAAGNNLGVKAARGEYVCLLNPDTLVAEDSFEILLQVAYMHKNTGALGPRLIDGSGQFLPESKRGLPTPAKAAFRMLGMHKYFPKSPFWNAYYAPHLAENENNPVEVLVGACFLIKRKCYLKVGGLDERFFMYGEDIDLSYRLSRSGYQNYYVGTAKVVHFKGESALKETDYRQRFAEAMQLFYEKHYGKNPVAGLFVNFLSKWYSKTKIQPSEKLIKPPEYVFLPKNSALENIIDRHFPKSKIIHYDHLRNLRGRENCLTVVNIEQVCLKDFFKIMKAGQQNMHRFAFCDKNLTFIMESSSSHLTGKIYLHNNYL